MNYSIRIACKNQAKVINFTSDLQMTVVFDLFRAVVKDSYSLHITPFFKKHRGKAVSFEEALKMAKELRFYKTETVSHMETKHTWEYETSLVFPCKVSVNHFHSEWGGTFFKIAFEKKSLVEPDFDSIKSRLGMYNIDLFKSKTEGLWYSHRYLDLQCEMHTIIVGRRYSICEWVNKTEKIEL